MSYRGGRERGSRGFERARGRGRGGSEIHEARSRGEFRGTRTLSFRGQRGFGQTRGRDIRIFRQGESVIPPNEGVHTLEDKTFSVLASSKNQLVTSQPPQRPGYGTQGRQVILFANYFELLPSKQQPLHKYSFVIKTDNGTPPIGKKLAQCTRLLLEQLPLKSSIVTDFSAILISSRPLGFQDRDVLIHYRHENEEQPRPGAPQYTAHVHFDRSLFFGDLIEYLASTDIGRAPPPGKDEMIHALNILIGYGFKTETDLITKRNQYFPFQGQFADRFNLASGIEAFRGFFASVRAATGRILLNVQVKHISAYQTMPLTTLLTKLSHDGMSVVNQEKFIRRVKVRTTHLSPPRLKIIAGFANRMDGKSLKNPPIIKQHRATPDQVQLFLQDDNRYVSVANYFQQKYQKKVSAPVVNVGTQQNPVYMPADVCLIAPGQEYASKLSPEATKSMIKFAVRPAFMNAESITVRGYKMLSHYREKSTQGSAIDIKEGLITVTGRVRAQPSVYYKGEQVTRPRDGSWNMQNVRFNDGALMPPWSFIWITTRASRDTFTNIDEVTASVRQLQEMMLQCGMRSPAPLTGCQLQINDSSNPGPEIETMFQRAAEFEKGPRLLLVILPEDDSKIYNAVKVAGDIKTGIATVIVLGTAKKFAGGNKQYLANVALKVNLKCGGNNQRLRSTDLGFITEGTTMLVGVDVTHPQPGAQTNAPSIAGIVASVDKNLGQWPADIRIQTGRQEMVQALQDMFRSRLLLWRQRNGSLPTEILVYRDGVSEGQYNIVTDVELPQMRKACELLYTPPQTKSHIPRITIIICGKRHHTRFYPTNENDADPRTGATLSGTVVDRGVTESRVWDFYVQAHAALQGTPRPCHYVVVHDEIFRHKAAENPRKDTPTLSAADTVETITHNLCYMFGRATKAVSLCPPAYYADILCERARRWVSRVYDDDAQTVASGQTEMPVREEDVIIHSRLKDTMFYI